MAEYESVTASDFTAPTKEDLQGITCYEIRNITDLEELKGVERIEKQHGKVN